MSEIKKPLTKESLSNLPKEGKNVDRCFDMIKEMTSLEKNELVEKIKIEFQVGETVTMPQTGVSTSEKTEEKGGNVSIKIVEIKETGVNKIKAYGVIKDLINELQEESINIVQAKKKAEEGDKIILTNIPREKAENIKKQLAEKKVEVEIK